MFCHVSAQAFNLITLNMNQFSTFFTLAMIAVLIISFVLYLAFAILTSPFQFGNHFQIIFISPEYFSVPTDLSALHNNRFTSAISKL